MFIMHDMFEEKLKNKKLRPCKLGDRFTNTYIMILYENVLNFGKIKQEQELK